MGRQDKVELHMRKDPYVLTHVKKKKKDCTTPLKNLTDCPKKKIKTKIEVSCTSKKSLS